MGGALERRTACGRAVTVRIGAVSQVGDGGGAPITGLSHVQLLVSDTAASAAWYRVALGLVSFAEDASIGYVALRHRGARMVVVLTEGRPHSSQGDGFSDQRVDHLAFAVPDAHSLEVWAEHLRSVGVAHDGVVLENGHRSLQLLDPDGLAIELVAP
jgi:catechol-2,3-dioxygenase